MKIKDILDKTIPGLGFELVDVEYTPAKLVRIFIDKDGGVNIDDCELVSQHVSKLFMVEEIDYNRLEVSSPGLERPLRKLQDFTRFIGKLAKVKTFDEINQQKVFEGIITSVDGETINLGLEDSTSLSIEFSNINRARLVFKDKKPLLKRK